MTLSLSLVCTFGFSSATGSSNNTDTCTIGHPLQGSLFVPLCLVGRSSPPGLVVIEVRFSQQFFGILVVMVSAVSTATAMHSDQQLRPHCFFQPNGAGASALSGSVAHHLRPLETCLFHQRPTRDQTPVSVDIVVHLYTLVQDFVSNEDQLSHQNVQAHSGRWKTSHRDAYLTVEVPTPRSQRTKNVYVCTACDQTCGLLR